MKQRGFTLIELVLVIVILGILSAVALPTFVNLQDDAKKSAVKGALGGLRSGVAIWYARNAASGTATFPTLGELESSPGGVMQIAVPSNPYTNTNDIVTGTSEFSQATAGWIYDQATGRLFSSAAATQGCNF